MEEELITEKKESEGRGVLAHFKSLGFTNRLALYIVLLLAVSVCMGFFLAIFSIRNFYTGSLLCFTVIATPLDTCLGIVLRSIVQKSAAENTEGGINYAKATSSLMTTTFEQYSKTADYNVDSPPI